MNDFFPSRTPDCLNHYFESGAPIIPGIPIPVTTQAEETRKEKEQSQSPCGAGYVPHVIKKGDTLSKIAAMHKTTVALIIMANPGLRASTKLAIGKTLCIPQPIPCDGERYVLKAGDTIWDIAGRYNLTVEDILNANPTLNPKFYRAGDTICIPGTTSGRKPEKGKGEKPRPSEPEAKPKPEPLPLPPIFFVPPSKRPERPVKPKPEAPSPAPKPTPRPEPKPELPDHHCEEEREFTGQTYTVRPGDTLCSILCAANTSYFALKQANPHVDLLNLKPGTVLNVVSMPMIPQCPLSNRYIIGPGETICELAERFCISQDALLLANPYYTPDFFTCGNMICVPREIRPLE